MVCPATGEARTTVRAVGVGGGDGLSERNSGWMLRSSTTGDGSRDNVGVFGALDDTSMGDGVELRRRLSSEVLISGGSLRALRSAIRGPGRAGVLKDLCAVFSGRPGV